MKKTNKIPVINPFDFCDKKNIREAFRGVFHDPELHALVATDGICYMRDSTLYNKQAETGGVTTEKGEFIKCETPRGAGLIGTAERYPRITHEMPDAAILLAAAKAAEAAEKQGACTVLIEVVSGQNLFSPKAVRLMATVLLNYGDAEIRWDRERALLIDTGKQLKQFLFMPRGIAARQFGGIVVQCRGYR